MFFHASAIERLVTVSWCIRACEGGGVDRPTTVTLQYNMLQNCTGGQEVVIIVCEI